MESDTENQTSVYDSKTVVRLVGITSRQLDYWYKTDLVSPSATTKKTKKGSGVKRFYTFKDLLMLKVVKKFLDVGISIQKIRKAITYLKESEMEDLYSLTLVSDGNSIYNCISDDQLIDIVKGGQGVFAICVNKVYTELKENKEVTQIELSSRIA